MGAKSTQEFEVEFYDNIFITWDPDTPEDRRYRAELSDYEGLVRGYGDTQQTAIEDLFTQLPLSKHISVTPI